MWENQTFSLCNFQNIYFRADKLRLRHNYNRHLHPIRMPKSIFYIGRGASQCTYLVNILMCEQNDIRNLLLQELKENDQKQICEG